MNKRIFYTPIITVLVGLFFSFVVALSLYNSEKQAVRYELQQDIDSAAMSFNRELNVTVDILYLLQSEMLSEITLDYNKLQTLSYKILERLPFINSIKWLSRIEQDSKIEFEYKMLERDPSYQMIKVENQNISPVDSKNHYFPITYSSEPSEQMKIFRFDFSSIESMQKEIDTSWHQGIPIGILSNKLQRILTDQANFFLLIPMFNGIVNTRYERINKLNGFFLLSLDVVNLFESVLSVSKKEPIKLSLKQYHNDNVEIVHENVEGISSNLMKDMHYSAKPFFFAGKEWQVSGVPSKEYVEHRMTNYPYIIFAFGSSVFLLLAYLLYILQSRTLNIHQKINEKTRELKVVNRKLEKMAKCDGVTGLFNRNYFEETLDSELKRAQRDELPISILLVEIDNLTSYCNENGQGAVDNMVRLIGSSLLDSLKRPSDLVARYAEDSFAVILPNTKNATPIANQCLEVISKLKIPLNAKQEKEYISVSIGGVTTVEAEKIDTFKLKAFAQVALSKAIAQGRNRIQWIFSPETNLSRI